MCIGSDKFLSGLLTPELTFRMLWNNIEGATSPAWCELPHQYIYKQFVSQAHLLVAHRTIQGDTLGRPGDL